MPLLPPADSAKRKVSIGLSVALVVLASVTAVIGQTDVDQTTNKADHTLRAAGRVNPSSLGMEMSIPLGNYSGRGISVPINLSYSSKVWRMDYLEGDLKPIGGGCRNMYEPRFAEHSTSGWTASLEVPYVEYTGRDNQYLLHGYTFGQGKKEVVLLFRL